MASAINSAHHNLTLLVREVDDVAVVPDTGARYREEEYERFLADVWVGVVLTLMVLSCVCCVCSCLLYHRFQQWKRSGKSVNSVNPVTGYLPGWFGLLRTPLLYSQRSGGTGDTLLYHV